jgi:hypothetical protein
MSVTKAARRDHLDTEAGVDQLIRPGSRLEEHELQLMSALADVLKHRLQGHLGAAEPTPPRHDYEDTHGSSSAAEQLSPPRLSACPPALPSTLEGYLKDNAGIDRRTRFGETGAADDP